MTHSLNKTEFREKNKEKKENKKRKPQKYKMKNFWSILKF